MEEVNYITDPKWVSIWMKAGEYLLIIFFGIYTWVNTRTKASQAAVAQLAKQHRQDMAALEKRRAKSRKEIEARTEASYSKLSNHMDQMQSDLIDRVDTVETDVRRLSNQVHSMPSKNDIIRLHERVDESAKSSAASQKTSAATASAVSEMGRTLAVIQTHLIGEGKK